MSFYFVIPLDIKRTPLKKTLLIILSGNLFFAACKKENFQQPETDPCTASTADPTGRSYATDSVVAVNYSKKQCGIMPLGSRNYWIYEDSVFTNGVFTRVQYDTLRYTKTYQSLPDNLIWWESNIDIGIPSKLFANDSTLFGINDRFFTPGIIDVKKDYSLFTGDSVKYLASFEDNAAMGRSVKMNTVLETKAGVFSGWILFEKNARNYRKDQVYFKPGLGVVKYIVEKAPMGSRVIQLQQVSTLVAFYLE